MSSHLDLRLPQLQNLMKRDPEGYKEEFAQQFARYSAGLHGLHLATIERDFLKTLGDGAFLALFSLALEEAPTR